MPAGRWELTYHYNLSPHSCARIQDIYFISLYWLIFFFKFPLQNIELHMGYYGVIKSFVPLMRIECYRIKRIISFLVEEMPKALYLESRLQCFPYSMVC